MGINGHTYFCTAVVSFAGSGACLAGPDYKLKLYDSWGNGQGGEFRAEVIGNFAGPAPKATGTDFQGGVGPSKGNRFEAFCLEMNEFINFNTAYSADLNTQTHSVETGTNFYNAGAHGGYDDKLDPRTAYLYQKFIYGDLTDYHYLTSDQTEIDARKADATSLQRTIWFIEQELGNGTYLDVNTVLGNTNQQARKWWIEANNAIANNWSGLGSVRVLNLYRIDGVGNRLDHQDQLVVIPVPAAVLLASGPVAGLLMIRRRPLA